MANLVYRSTPAANVAGNNNKGVALIPSEVDGNFFGLQVDVNNRALKAGDTFTGNVSISGAGNVTLAVSGDVTAYRTGGTTGYIYLSNGGNKYLGNNGTDYTLPTQGLIVGGMIQGTSFSGAGTGLTGSASALSVGGSASSVTAASQTNITTLGTLTSLTVTGAVTANGGIVVTGALSTTGLITSQANALHGKVTLAFGTLSNSGNVGFYTPTGRQGYIGSSATTATLDAGTIPYVAGNHAFTGTGSFSGLLTASAGLNVTGATVLEVTSTTDLSVSGIITIAAENAVIQKTTTLTTISSSEIIALPAGSYRSVDLHIQAHDALTGKIHTSRILAAHNGTIADYTEYGVINLGGAAWSAISITYSASVASLGGVPGIRVMVTPVSINSTKFKVLAIATKV